ncbi:GGDEF domain-containing protein [Nitrobacteraceae bacterium UC4446_H13]
MLSMPTLWVVLVANFMALGLIWTYVMRSYPNFGAARYWTAAAFSIAIGACIGMFRMFMPPLIPLMVGAMFLVVGSGLAAMGVERFYGRPASWRFNIALAIVSFVALNYFVLVYPSTSMRIFVYSIAQSIPVGLMLTHLFSPVNRTNNPGARLAGAVAALIVAVNGVRAVTSLFDIGGVASMVDFNQLQAVLVLVLVFLSMAWNFGFLLMAIDRLRGEVANLALFDELTGVANRRMLLQRLPEACAVAKRTGEPFVMLAIDLDSFKAINDGHGHVVGDECLRLFARTVQSQLRPDDLLARSGGDEFCAVLPATTLREGAMIARHIVEACRAKLSPEQGVPFRLAASIGVAQWTPQIGMQPDRLIAAADQALYVAKNEGKDRYAVYQPPPSPEPAARIELRRTA